MSEKIRIDSTEVDVVGKRNTPSLKGYISLLDVRFNPEQTLKMPEVMDQYYDQINRVWTCISVVAMSPTQTDVQFRFNKSIGVISWPVWMVDLRARTSAENERLERQKGNVEKFLEATTAMGPVEGSVEWWRWHYAGLAMQGCLANSIDKNQGVEPWWHGGIQKISESSRMISDALIAELKKKGGEK